LPPGIATISSVTDKAERRQPRHPLHRHPLAWLATVELLLTRPLVVDPLGERLVLILALRYVAVVVRRLVGR
jgi:hypothetical protein